MDCKIFTKEELINELCHIQQMGWIENTRRKTNDGAAGNMLEDLLGIEENNLPIPNAAEWELKTKKNLDSLLTLFHQEPSPLAVQTVVSVLLPHFGWHHKQAGRKYPENTKSFRTTLRYGRYTRGFTIDVDEDQQKIVVKFDPSEVRKEDQTWLRTISGADGIPPKLEIEPYWGFNDLCGKAQTKLHNCFLVMAQSKRMGTKTFFHFWEAWMLKDFNSRLFIEAIKTEKVYVDFDARTGHNHGTKFRISVADFINLYSTREKLFENRM